MEQLAMCYEFSDRKSVLLSYSGTLYLHEGDLYRAFRQLKPFVSIQADKPHVPHVYTYPDIPNI